MNVFPINGIGAMKMNTDIGTTHCTLCPVGKNTTHSVTVEPQVLSFICATLTACSVQISNWNLLKNFELANPHFSAPDNINLLLGADLLFPALFLNGLISCHNSQLCSIHYFWLGHYGSHGNLQYQFFISIFILFSCVLCVKLLNGFEK